MAIIGAALANKRAGNKVITTSVEHPSVTNAFAYLEGLGFDVVYLPVNEVGFVDADVLADAVDEGTILVSTMYVNNEIGTVFPVEEYARIIKSKNPSTLFHVDAIQAFGKFRIHPGRENIDMMSISGHKLHGPKGTGALFIKKGTKVKPIIHGGGQQGNMRSGTENVPGYAGLGLAAKLTCDGMEEKTEHLRALKARLVEGLSDLENIYIHPGAAPHIVSISFVGVRSQVLLNAMGERGVYVSAGSACSTNKNSVSHVLKALNLPKEQLESTLRFSFSPANTFEEIDYAAGIIKELFPVLRRYTRKK